MANNKEARKGQEVKKEPENSQKSSAGFKFEELELSIPEMLKNGVHFGHKKSRWNPKMKRFIFSERNGISIIDLEKTATCFEKAIEFTRTVSGNGGKIIFVGTKPQARDVVKFLAEATGMPYVTNRWLGGTFSNFSEIKKRIKYLNDQEMKSERGELNKYTKYEQMRFQKEIERMNEKMGGIKKMETLPQALFAVDVNENRLAIKEARESKIPVIAITDTNTDPDLADYPIPGNDDALSSLRYIAGLVAKNIKEARGAAKAASEQKKDKNGKSLKNPMKK